MADIASSTSSRLAAILKASHASMGGLPPSGFRDDRKVLKMSRSTRGVPNMSESDRRASQFERLTETSVDEDVPSKSRKDLTASWSWSRCMGASERSCLEGIAVKLRINSLIGKHYLES
jgi:hypothetical protein